MPVGNSNMEFLIKRIRNGALSYIAEVEHGHLHGEYVPEWYANEIRPFHIILVSSIVIFLLPFVLIALCFSKIYHFFRFLLFDI